MPSSRPQTQCCWWYGNNQKRRTSGYENQGPLEIWCFFSLELCSDPYVMEEEDPAQCHALESSLWEIKVRFRWSNSTFVYYRACSCLHNYVFIIFFFTLSDAAESLPSRRIKSSQSNKPSSPRARRWHQRAARTVHFWGVYKNIDMFLKWYTMTELYFYFACLFL